MEPQNAFYDYALALFSFPKDMPEVYRLYPEKKESWVWLPDRKKFPVKSKNAAAEESLREYFEKHGIPERALALIKSGNQKPYFDDHAKDFLKLRLALREKAGRLDIQEKADSFFSVLFHILLV